MCEAEHKIQSKRLLVQYFEAKGYTLVDIAQGYLWYRKPGNTHVIFINMRKEQVARGNSSENLENVTEFFKERAEVWRKKTEMETKKIGCGK